MGDKKSSNFNKHRIRKGDFLIWKSWNSFLWFYPSAIKMENKLIKKFVPLWDMPFSSLKKDIILNREENTVLWVSISENVLMMTEVSYRVRQPPHWTCGLHFEVFCICGRWKQQINQEVLSYECQWFFSSLCWKTLSCVFIVASATWNPGHRTLLITEITDTWCFLS